MFLLLRWLAFLLFLAFGASPYITLYYLNQALVKNDTAALALYVDLPSVQTHQRASTQQQMDDYLKTMPQAFRSMLEQSPQWASSLHQGAQALLQTQVDLTWVRDQLLVEQNGVSLSLFTGFSFAFFESPTRFLVRIGSLDHKPVHFYLRFQDWSWQVTAIYP